ncbi:hypothetical protein HZB74_01655 [Candidatus Saccharibacteria bacterium]|nr:hypothetical protein [Candidatus Saccharibacteria bacterium]
MSKKNGVPDRNFEFVEQHSWRKGEGKIVLETGAIGACTGIATFSRATKTGHLLHEPLVESTGDLDNFFKSVVESAGDPKKIKVWVRGAAFDSNANDYDYHYNEHVEAARQLVEEKIAELGLAKKQIDIEWAGEDESIDMSIDCHNGKFSEETTTYTVEEDF